MVKKGRAVRIYAFLRIPFTLSLIAIIIMSLGDDAIVGLRYDRQAIFNGELWRLLSAHLAHLSWPHTAMNLIGLWLLWLLYGNCTGIWQWVLTLLFTGIGISLGLLLLDPELGWYVGLSGILHGIFSFGIICRLRAGTSSEWLMLALLIIKLAWEQRYGSMPGSAELAGGPVIIDAHLYGAILGGLCVYLTPPTTTGTLQHQ